jgi:hypothetical protein
MGTRPALEGARPKFLFSRTGDDSGARWLTVSKDPWPLVATALVAAWMDHGALNPPKTFHDLIIMDRLMKPRRHFSVQ